MDIVLHIGTEKTGTSTIQSVINSSGNWLSENSVIAPSSLRPNGIGDNQVVLPAMFCQAAEKTKLRARAGQHKNETDDAFDKRVITAFDKEMDLASKRDIKTILISSEHLSSRLWMSKDIQNLARWLKKYGRVTKIIVYLRRQDKFLVSSYSTDLKSGRLRPFKMPGVKWAKQRYDYQNLLTLWGDVFGYNTLIVRPFERARFVNEDLIDDFSYYAGLKYGTPERSKDKNLSLDPKGLAVLLRYNQWASKTDYGSAEDGRRRLVKLLEDVSTSKRVTISSHKALEFMDRYADGNEWVAKNFLDDEKALFTEVIDLSNKGSMRPQADVDDLFPFFMHVLLDATKDIG